MGGGRKKEKKMGEWGETKKKNPMIYSLPLGNVNSELKTQLWSISGKQPFCSSMNTQPFLFLSGSGNLFPFGLALSWSVLAGYKQ